MGNLTFILQNENLCRSSLYGLHCMRYKYFSFFKIQFNFIFLSLYIYIWSCCHIKLSTSRSVCIYMYICICICVSIYTYIQRPYFIKNKMIFTLEILALSIKWDHFFFYLSAATCSSTVNEVGLLNLIMFYFNL